MARPGPRRHPVPLRLTDEEERPARDLAETLPPLPRGTPNLSAALRLLIAAGAEHHARPHVPISDAGAAALDQLATEAGLTREEVARLALAFAVQRARHWLPTRKDTP